MKRLLCGLILAVSQIITSAAMPTASIALSVGQWIVKDSKHVYYVRIEGRGEDRTQARNNAFRKAIELAVGVVVVGETETQSDRLLRNDVIGYSSGIVNDYKIISETNTSVIMDVWVSDSEIANRLQSLGGSTGSGRVDGDAIRRDWERKQAQDQSAKQRDIDSVKLTSMVLNDYPRMAYESTVKSTSIIYINERPTMNISVNVKFSEKYIKSLDELLIKTRDNVPFSWTGNEYRDKASGVQLRYGLLSWTNGSWLNRQTFDVWSSRLDKPTSMEIKFYNAANVMTYRTCWNLNDLLADMRGLAIDDSPVNRGLNIAIKNRYVIKPNEQFTANFHFVNYYGWTDEQFVRWVSSNSKVEAQVIDTSECAK